MSLFDRAREHAMHETLRILRSLSTIALLVAALAAVGSPLSAQSHRGAISVLGGGSDGDDITPGFAEPTVLESGWIAGLQAERWLGGGRTGLRLNTLYTQRLLEGGGGDYNVFAADVDLLIRLLGVREGRALAPYIALGAGATHYAGVAGSPSIGGGIYGDHPVIRGHLLAGFGIDAFSSRRGGLRLEVADKIVVPSVGESPPATGLPMSHELVVTAGVQLRVGGPRETAVIAHAAAPGSTETAQAAPARPNVEPAEAAGPAEVFTVQVGSFVDAPTAGRWAERLRRRGIPVWLMETVIQGERVSRVRVGALDSESEAHSLAAALERDYGWPVSVDAVAPDEPRPADALTRTRDFLYRL